MDFAVETHDTHDSHSDLSHRAMVAHGARALARWKALARRLMGLVCLVGFAALAGCQTTPVHGLTAEQIAALKSEGFTQTEDGWEFGLSDKVLFDTDEFVIHDAARQTVARIGRTLLKVGLNSVSVYGYTDSVGSDTYNEQLSARRADVVANVLVEAGMQRAAIQTIGAGKRNPVADNSTATGRAQNRRVAIVISTR
ncbi:OmpA family protein [Pandoraea sp. XJJ-1]|uniref:OmpA family protein n=1 Tax=unclassified Pandoraea TaxID=2624094 RepID=UPI0021C329E5|nr:MULTISPECIES: OmpA family protein [unclassified Pandoraea]WAL82259.1 OmpA family protein [Pandoraea sp. XJJ-1]